MSHGASITIANTYSEVIIINPIKKLSLFSLIISIPNSVFQQLLVCGRGAWATKKRAEAAAWVAFRHLCIVEVDDG